MTQGRISDQLDLVLGLVGSGPTGLDGRLDMLESNLLTSGQETIPRVFCFNNSVAVATQSLRLTYFTARKSESSTQVRVFSGNTAAAATPTLCRVGLYAIAANGDGTLVASIANDTTLFAATNTAYTRSWSAPYSMVAGQRYALAMLIVSGAATPTFVGQTVFPQGAAAAELMVAPALAGLIAAQADLPASFVAGSVSATSAARIYAAIIP